MWLRRLQRPIPLRRYSSQEPSFADCGPNGPPPIGLDLRSKRSSRLRPPASVHATPSRSALPQSIPAVRPTGSRSGFPPRREAAAGRSQTVRVGAAAIGTTAATGSATKTWPELVETSSRRAAARPALGGFRSACVTSHAGDTRRRCWSGREGAVTRRCRFTAERQPPVPDESRRSSPGSGRAHDRRFQNKEEQGLAAARRPLRQRAFVCSIARERARS
jgi:hypothetical protein